MPYAKTAFSAGVLGFVHKGQEVPEDSPLFAGREVLFERVEQATAAPGEVRDVVPPSKKVDCPVEGCDYAGSKHGLSIHTGRSH